MRVVEYHPVLFGWVLVLVYPAEIHPSISTGYFSLVLAAPVSGGTVDLSNSFGNQWATGSCNLIATNVPLPVELLSFRATPLKKQVKLEWATASEINFSHYDLERSMDGRNFAPITHTNGKGNTHNSYSYTDTDVKPATTYYYRLKMVDLDGAYEYSHVVQASIEGDGFGLVNVSPNPTENEVTVRYNVGEGSEVYIRLMDMNGKILYLNKNWSPKGFNTTNLDLSGYADGLYILTIKNGSEQIQHKIVKH